MKILLVVTLTVFVICSGALRGLAMAAPTSESPPSQQQAAQSEGNPPSSPATAQSPATIEVPSPSYSLEALSVKEKALKALEQKDFAYNPGLLSDPFVPFIKPPEPSAPEVPPVVSEEDETLPPEMQRPLTPLQRMNIGEIERGLRAIVWGDLGRKAVIQDSAGKGYIVGVGTPAGGSSGVITQIFNDRLIIQQQVWDKDQKKLVPRNEIISLRKQAEG